MGWQEIDFRMRFQSTFEAGGVAEPYLPFASGRLRGQVSGIEVGLSDICAAETAGAEPCHVSSW